MSGTERTRVLRVIGRLNMGGPAHQAALLSGRRLDPDRYETLLVHGSLAPGEESLTDLAEQEGARMHFLPELQQPVHPTNDLRAQANLIRLARRYQPHIVHTHTAKAGFLGRQAALATRPRPAIVHTFHGHVLEGYFGRTKSRLYCGLESVLGGASDRLIGVSQATVDDLVRLGVAQADKFKVLHLGLDLAPLSEAAPEARREQRAALELADEDLLLVFVGRVVPIKRLDVLLNALAETREAGTPAKLALVGDGDCRPALEQQAAQLGLTKAVHFLGYRRDLQSIFAAADIAILTSANEGTPVSLIEAAAAGVPAVATDVGGVSDVVTEETGILAPSGDASAVAAGISRLAASIELRSKLGAAAKQRSIQRYSAERLLADIDSLYIEILAGQGQPGSTFLRPNRRLHLPRLPSVDAVKSLMIEASSVSAVTNNHVSAEYYEAISEQGRHPSALRCEMELAFDRVQFEGKSVLDIGAGAGAASLYAAAAGAARVVALEPESKGSKSDMQERFNRARNRLGVEQVSLLPQTFQEFDSGGETFDILISFASINHIDEEACTHLHSDPEARASYRELLTKLFELANPGANLVIMDCSRSNLFDWLGMKSPFAPTIEWEKHQSPRLWAELLAEVGFTQPRIRWTTSSRLRRPGQVLFGNRILSQMTSSHFLLSMTKPDRIY